MFWSCGPKHNKENAPPPPTGGWRCFSFLKTIHTAKRLTAWCGNSKIVSMFENDNINKAAKELVRSTSDFFNGFFVYLKHF
jgi:hypothetical protein